MKRGFRSDALLLCGLVVVLAACGHSNNSTTGNTVTTPPGNVPWTFVGGPILVGQSGAYGTQGIGAAIAKVFAQEIPGVRLALVARNAKNLASVARACATNRVALAIPCHRVVAADGTLGSITRTATSRITVSRIFSTSRTRSGAASGSAR